MRSVFERRWIYVVSATVILVFAIMGAARVSSQDEQHDPNSRRRELLEGPEQTLSVDQTLGALFDPQYGGSPRKYYARANPEAKDVLYRVLDNDKLHEFHDRAWEILGYIGGESHVERVEEAIKNFKPIPRRLEPDERDALRALFNSLGVLCGRKVVPACHLAETMMDPAYWRDAKFRLSSPPRSEYRVISQLMFGYALSLDPEIGKYGQSILETIEDPKERESWRKAFSREAMLRIGWNTRHREAAPVTHQERHELSSFFNGDLQDPGPARPPRDIDPEPPAADQGDAERRPSAEKKSPESDLDQLKQIAHQVELNADGQIEYLILRGEEVTDETLGLLRAAPQLRTLALQNAAVTDQGLKDLPRYAPQLRELSLTNTEITDSGLTHLKGLENLEDLSLSQSRKISYRGMKHVGRLNRLTELQLWELPNLTDQGIQDLQSLQSLQILRLHSLPITDAALEHVASLLSLEELHIRNCPIEGWGLSHLEEIEGKITHLRLRGVPLIDHALRYLENLDRLEELVLGETGNEGYVMHVTDEAIEKLQEALPETEIRDSRAESWP